MMSKNNNTHEQFIVGIYYNHIMMINHYIPVANKSSKKHNPFSLPAKKNKTIYKPIINAIVFDIETT